MGLQIDWLARKTDDDHIEALAHATGLASLKKLSNKNAVAVGGSRSKKQIMEKLLTVYDWRHEHPTIHQTCAFASTLELTSSKLDNVAQLGIPRRLFSASWQKDHMYLI